MNPSQLRDALRRLAANYWWTWHADVESLLRSLPGSGADRHPIDVIDALTTQDLETLGQDESFGRMVESQVAAFEVTTRGEPPTIAYCSPEFGISDLLPQYSGGLGVLAGDHLKAASDLATPVIGVGLLYTYGVFRQVIEAGHQTETHSRLEPHAIGAEDTGIDVRVPFPGRDVVARVWSVGVGRTRLLLLSTNVDANSEHDREITDHLYQGTPQHRLEQEMVLGIGGAKALATLGLDIEVHHLNEGHAGFIALQLIDRSISSQDFASAVAEARRGIVFTTHTPVPAGIDRFHRHDVEPYLQIWASRWGAEFDEIWALGQDPDDPERFNMAALCLRMSSSANGVSRLHGEVSREMFHGVGIGSTIGHVTNGVHARTWTAPSTQDLFDEALGPEWASGDPAAWDRVEVLGDDQITGIRRTGALKLADMVNATTGHKLDPDALIIGFARRFAPYKRANLLFQHMLQLEALLQDDERPLHFVFSGKAHPADDPGKALVAEVIAFSESDRSLGRFSFVPDYDMGIAATLVQGCDVWLNNPIRPREASGTSGEKVALNGGLNCSILDGWWAEMFDGRNGWGINPSPEPDPGTRDHEESASLLAALAAIAEEYHHGRSIFYGRVRHAWQTLGPKVTAARMVRDYESQVYAPAALRSRD